MFFREYRKLRSKVSEYHRRALQAEQESADLASANLILQSEAQASSESIGTYKKTLLNYSQQEREYNETISQVRPERDEALARAVRAENLLEHAQGELKAGDNLNRDLREEVAKLTQEKDAATLAFNNAEKEVSQFKAVLSNLIERVETAATDAHNATYVAPV